MLGFISNIFSSVTSFFNPVNVFSNISSWIFGNETLSRSFMEKNNEIIHKLPLNDLSNSLLDEEKEEEQIKIDFSNISE